jgi:hypothetical protein
MLAVVGIDMGRAFEIADSPALRVARPAIAFDVA